MSYIRICPRCFVARPPGAACATASCVEQLNDPRYVEDDLEGNLHIAQTMLAEGDGETDWKTVVRELEEELVAHQARFGAAAFKQ